jgi:thiamine-monophosphate kinase
LGGAAAGLALLEAGAEGPAALIRRQRRPRPPFALGPRLARRKDVAAAIDLSDGLAQDLAHVARASGVRAELDLERLPLAPGLRPACRTLGSDPLALALHGGEDYELLICVRPGAPAAERVGRQLGVRLTEIGRITRGHGVVTLRNGEPWALPGSGWNHFKPS